MTKVPLTKVVDLVLYFLIFLLTYLLYTFLHFMAVLFCFGSGCLTLFRFRLLDVISVQAIWRCFSCGCLTLFQLWVFDVVSVQAVRRCFSCGCVCVILVLVVWHWTTFRLFLFERCFGSGCLKWFRLFLCERYFACCCCCILQSRATFRRPNSIFLNCLRGINWSMSSFVFSRFTITFYCHFLPAAK